MMHFDIKINKIDIKWGPGAPGGVPWDPRVGTHGIQSGETHVIPWGHPWDPRGGPRGPIGLWGPRPLGIHWPLGTHGPMGPGVHGPWDLGPMGPWAHGTLGPPCCFCSDQ